MTDKQIIIDGVDVSECEYFRETLPSGFLGKHRCNCDSINTMSFNCEGNNCIYKQLKAKEQELTHYKKENERLLQTIIKDQAEIVQKNIDETNILLIKENMDLQQQLDQLKAELKSAKELREYTYDCCKQAGEELAKNSFEWDGKEKNLVVQAMELNERYDQLKADDDELKKEFNGICNFNKSLLDENYKLACIKIKLKQTLTEIKPILELYTNSKIGEEQPDGTYKYSGKYIESKDLVYINYDPRPAREGLKKISKALDAKL